MLIREKEEWRTLRLQKAVRIASSILNMDQRQLEALIQEVEDVKGVLVVRWLHPMTDAQKRAFGTAWELCGEKAGNTDHIVSW